MRPAPPQDQKPSRTAIKLAALAVTELCHKIADLPDAAFRRLPLSAETRADFEIARSLKSSGARDRVLRHLSAVLREEDEQLAQLRAALDGTDQQHRDESRLFHHLETLRDRLLDPEQQAVALAQAVQEFPALDRPALERALKLYHKTADKAAFRAVFKLLRDAAKATPPPA